MIIRSKKTGLVHEVSKDEWAQMNARYDSRHYTVIDSSDDDLKSVVVDMDEIKPFDDDMAEGQKEPIVDEEAELEWIKKKLDEAEVKYHPNTGIVKLRKLYEQI